jgi:hypothetical protein
LHEVDGDPRLNFWRVIYGTMLDMAIIDWCKLFGANEDSQHWKNVVPESEHDDFRRDLHKAVGMSRDKFHRYWEELKLYRDTRATHYDPFGSMPKYPQFDVALKAAYFYYAILNRMHERGEAHHYPVDFADYCLRFSEQAREAAKLAIAATATMDEKVM